MKVIRQLMLVLGLVLTGSFGVAMAAQDVLPVEIIPNDEEFGGASIGEWDIRSWQWALSFPDAISPMDTMATTADQCGYGQHGPVFFLPPIIGNHDLDVTTIHCRVPQGLGLYVSIDGNSCSTLEEPPYFGATAEELTTCAQGREEGNTLDSAKLLVNGVEVEDVMQYTFTSPAVPFMLGEDNTYGIESGAGLIASNGTAFIIAPPDPGTYVIDLFIAWGGHQEWHLQWTVDVLAPEVRN